MPPRGFHARAMESIIQFEAGLLRHQFHLLAELLLFVLVLPVPWRKSSHILPVIDSHQ